MSILDVSPDLSILIVLCVNIIHNLKSKGDIPIEIVEQVIEMNLSDKISLGLAILILFSLSYKLIKWIVYIAQRLKIHNNIYIIKTKPGTNDFANKIEKKYNNSHLIFILMVLLYYQKLEKDVHNNEK